MIVYVIICAGWGAGMYLARRYPVWEKIRAPCWILLVFGIMGCMAEMPAAFGASGISSGRIARKAPGEGDLETEAYIYLPQEDTGYPVTLTISERKYQQAEEQKLLAAAVMELEETFCGDNKSIYEITEDPRVLECYQNGAVFAEWVFSKEQFISSEGKINQQKLRDREKIEAAITLRCGESEKMHAFSFWIVPKPKSREELMALQIQEGIEAQDETERSVRLPEQIGGRRIEWREASSGSFAEILALGILSAFAWVYIKKEERTKKEQRRRQRLLFIYPEFVSKLSLLIGAGMSISRALKKMNQMYLRRKQNGGREEEAYEELSRMIFEMENGMGELRAYRKFAERCGLQPYRRLVSLLTAGQKTGVRRLREQLNEEADRAFLERKNAARRLGGEAGTKMLFPMIMMLAIVMGIILIPAFLSIEGLG